MFFNDVQVMSMSGRAERSGVIDSYVFAGLDVLALAAQAQRPPRSIAVAFSFNA